MPTYEYVCEKCGHTFDQFQSISAAPLTVCPQSACPRDRWGKGKVRRAISAGAGLIFKGSGFYITDYRSESYREAAKKDSAPKPAPAGDAKPAAQSAKSHTPKPESKPAAKKKD